MFVLAFYMKKFVTLLKIQYGLHKLTKSYVFYAHVLVVTVRKIDINHIIINKKACMIYYQLLLSKFIQYVHCHQVQDGHRKTALITKCIDWNFLNY